MRYSKEHKAETHRRVVEAAARRFRKEGIEGTGVADLMADCGLTHGGFYAHFPSKESLVREALMAASGHGQAHLRRQIDDARAEHQDPLERVVRHYLTALHRDRPDRGCCVAALGAEIARHPRKTREAFTAGLERTLDVIAAALPDPSHPQARETAYAIFSIMIGALQLSRLLADPKLSQNALDSGIKAALRLASSQAS